MASSACASIASRRSSMSLARGEQDFRDADLADLEGASRKALVLLEPGHRCLAQQARTRVRALQALPQGEHRCPRVAVGDGAFHPRLSELRAGTPDRRTITPEKRQRDRDAQPDQLLALRLGRLTGSRHPNGQVRIGAACSSESWLRAAVSRCCKDRNSGRSPTRASSSSQGVRGRCGGDFPLRLGHCVLGQLQTRHPARGVLR